MNSHRWPVADQSVNSRRWPVADLSVNFRRWPVAILSLAQRSLKGEAKDEQNKEM